MAISDRKEPLGLRLIDSASVPGGIVSVEGGVGNTGDASFPLVRNELSILFIEARCWAEASLCIDCKW